METIISLATNLASFFSANKFWVSIICLCMAVGSNFIEWGEVFKKEVKTLDSYVEKTYEIEYVLERIRGHYDSDYVAVSLVHNGVVTRNKIHLMKITRMFESKKLSIIGKKYLIKDVPVGPFVSIYKEVMHKGFIYIQNTEEYKDKFIGQQLGQYGTKTIVIIPLIKEEQIIGYLSIEWKKVVDLSQDTINIMLREKLLVESKL